MKYFKFLSFFLLFPVALQAQTDFKRIVPPNPNVASLFKSVITPATEYSGLPNVSIPLYTVTEGGLSVPISLSYATGGIQVSEEAGVVGLGWAINSGGAITRIINGADDFKPTYGYAVHSNQHPDPPTNGNLQFGYWRPDVNAFLDSETTAQYDSGPCDFLVNGTNKGFWLLPQDPQTNDYDYMPDMFHFNFNGYSGSFVLDASGFPFLLHKKGIHIEKIGNGSDGFKFIVEDGTIYEFRVKAMTTFPVGIEDDYVSSWFLKSITDIYGNQVIFHYDSTQKVQPFRTFSQSFISTPSSGTQGYSYLESFGPSTVIDDVLLTSLEVFKINSLKTQHVNFIYSPKSNEEGARLDNKSRYLDKIEVLNSNSDEIKSYDFVYRYFGFHKSYGPRDVTLANGDYAQTIGALGPEYPDLNLRLRLDSVTENDISTHTFEYYEQNVVPNKTTLGQDYWGFYNGAFNSGIFIPYAYGSSSQNSIFAQEKKANRLPSENFAKIFSLKSVIYPTKGRTVFDYELNTFDQNQNLGEFPASTVPQTEMASALSTNTFIPNKDTTVISPNPLSTLKITYNVTITGWNDSISSNKPQEPDWANDFYVEFQDINGNLVAPYSKIHIPSSQGQTEWASLTPQINSGSGPVINHSSTQIWSYDQNANNQLTDTEYKIYAYFNSHGGLYKGLVNIHAEWEDVEVDKTKQYSVGGGLRVSSIAEYDSDGTLETRKQYNYHYQEQAQDGSIIEKSYGKIKTVPNFSIDQISVFNMAIKYNGYTYGPQPRVIANATSHNSFSKDLGSYVGYDQVEIMTVGENSNNGKTIKKFHNQADHFYPVTPSIEKDSYYKFPPLRVPQNGLLKSETQFKREGNNYATVARTEHSYEINGVDDEQFMLDDMYETSEKVVSAVKQLPIFTYGDAGSLYWYCDAMKFQLYPHYSNLIQQTGTKEIIYNSEGIDSLVTLQEFKYENLEHLQRTESKMVNSKGEEVITKTYYPDDIFNENGNLVSAWGNLPISSEETAEINKLTKDYRHRIAEPIQTETIVNGETTVQRTYYKDWDQNPSLTSTKVWPEIVKTLKGDYDDGNGVTANAFENRLNFHRYDDFGNPLMVSKQDGAKICYIWGYNNKYPVAKVENASYTEIEGVLGTGLNLGNGGLTDSQANDLRTILTDAMVTTYTYDPLIGVTSVTDPRGYIMKYSYDSFNRLKEIRDENNHLVTDYKYHYKGENDQ